MTLREQLKERAESILNDYLETLHDCAEKMAMVNTDLILKIYIGGRCKSARAKAIRQIVAKIEQDLMKKYNDQVDAFPEENL